MAKKITCPQCGAKNAPDLRRCRICAQLINPDAEDTSGKPKGLPEHVQRQIDKTLGAAEPPGPGGFGGLPAPAGGDDRVAPAAAAGGDAWGGSSPGGAWDGSSGGGWGEAPGGDSWDTTGGTSGGDSWSGGDDWSGASDTWGSGDDIVIDVPARNPGVYDDGGFEPEPAPAESFDPNALFADMGRPDLAPPPVARPDLPPPPGAPPPPEPSRDLTMPPPTPKVDPFADLHVDGELSAEEIERLTQEHLREDRLRRRPGLLNKVFKADDEE